MIIFLLKSLTSMKQLYALTMDVHARYRTEAHQLIKPRFNERFIMSLKSNNNCIFLDDKWNFLSISNAMKVQPIGLGCQIIDQNSYRYSAQPFYALKRLPSG